MLLIVAAAGIIGSVVFGLRGLTVGSGQLDRILALVCLFATVGSVLGIRLDDGRRPKKTSVLTHDERIQLAMATPLVLLMTGVFLATLIPSIYVMLPFFGIWHLGSRARPMGPTPMHAPAPAYAP